MFRKKKNVAGGAPDAVLEIKGMSCAHCSARVEKALNEIEGITAKVDLKKGIASISGSSEIDAEKLCEAVKAAGYEAKVKELKTLR